MSEVASSPLEKARGLSLCFFPPGVPRLSSSARNHETSKWTGCNLGRPPLREILEQPKNTRASGRRACVLLRGRGCCLCMCFKGAFFFWGGGWLQRETKTDITFCLLGPHFDTCVPTGTLQHVSDGEALHQGDQQKLHPPKRRREVFCFG